MSSSVKAQSLVELERGIPFFQRHVGPTPDEQAKMLAVVGYGDLEDLMAAAIPTQLIDDDPLHLPKPDVTESEVTAELGEIARENHVLTSMIGLGYYGTITPAVIRRNVLENPAWYTAYTPYQPEVSQGRLEALLNFQTMVADLAGLPIANASLLDEATAAAEAMSLTYRMHDSGRTFLVDADCFPQTISVVRTRASALGIEVVVTDLKHSHVMKDVYGVLVQYPGSSGQVRDYSDLIDRVHGQGAFVVIAADLLALTVLRSPGEVGADVVVGSSQRFGVPVGYGGPHAGFIAVRDGLQRALPGRIVGVTRDAAGNKAYRLALQAREQHIRREKATSNICTAQVLPAVLASMYAVWHGPDGLRTIGQRVHRYTALLAEGLRQGGMDIVHSHFFDTILVRVPGMARTMAGRARDYEINVRLVDENHIGISCDETTSRSELLALWSAFEVSVTPDIDVLDSTTPDALPPDLLRTSAFLRHSVFHTHHSETEMLRYLRRLADKDLALDRTMIPLGSCTMKLNATIEMEPITWPEFSQLHPFAPSDQAAGYRRLFADLEQWLCEITGYHAVSLQPNAGSQGELAGLLAIRAYYQARGEDQRDTCLIPASAHGTNAASAAMAGLRVVVVACHNNGDVDIDDVRRRLAEYPDRVAALMITYPSTHGVFESGVIELCEVVHNAGAQVYVDGANLNALVGFVRLAQLGDVSHLNLHKTFCIPHGGGGPGMGPLAVREHLTPYLPNHPMQPDAGPVTGIGPVAAAPWGSPSILPVSWAYIRLMGALGLRYATAVAVLAANYVGRRLAPYFPVLYTGPHGLVAHECVLDIRSITSRTGVTAEDIAKRLIDFGIHAPTMSFPVPGTLMIEPTESESLSSLEFFCAAMIAIKAEIEKIVSGEFDATDNPLRNAPHTALMISGEWHHPYSRTEAAFPLPQLLNSKYWPDVRRVDNAYGDRNLVCSCVA